MGSKSPAVEGSYATRTTLSRSALGLLVCWDKGRNNSTDVAENRSVAVRS